MNKKVSKKIATYIRFERKKKMTLDCDSLQGTLRRQLHEHDKNQEQMKTSKTGQTLKLYQKLKEFG